MCFAVSINVLPWSLMFSSNYKCFAVADMGHRTDGLLVEINLRGKIKFIHFLRHYFYSTLWPRGKLHSKIQNS
jgi:hypothetical protein